MRNFTALDFVMLLVGAAITASAPTLLVALPLLMLGGLIHVVAQSSTAKAWGNHITTGIKDKIPLQLPHASTAMVVHEPVNSVEDTLRTIPWSKRITGEHQILDVGSAIQPTSMAHILQIMPKHIPFDHPRLPNAPTPMSVLIGYDPVGKRWIWADFGVNGDTVHAFIAGQTRSGKDSEIRFWFTQLTSNNTPEQIKFIIIDAKGEWTTPALNESSHMYLPPVGGFDLKIEVNNGKRKLRDLANEKIEDALINTIELLQKRMKEFSRVGAINLASYQEKTGKKLPILFIIITDVGSNLEGILEQLITFLVFKGGSLGVRAVVSMQTASGQSTGWRGQMGLAMSGFQGQASADAPNMGMPATALKYRPSELPSVDIPANRGLFVVRKGGEQYVVRAAYLPDNVFESYCANRLPHTNLLESLLFDQPIQQQIAVVKKEPKSILTLEQCKIAAYWSKKGVTPSRILTEYLKITSGPKYAQARPHVQMIYDAVNRKVN